MKGIIGYYYRLDPEDNVRLVMPQGLGAAAELRQLRTQQGGFRLVHRLITDDLLDCADTLYDGGQPSERATNVKTPHAAISNYFRMTRGEWQTEIEGICHATFRDMGKLAKLASLIETLIPKSAN